MKNTGGYNFIPICLREWKSLLIISGGKDEGNHQLMLYGLESNLCNPFEENFPKYSKDNYVHKLQVNNSTSG